jgi:hypothetical protein
VSTSTSRLSALRFDQFRARVWRIGLLLLVAENDPAEQRALVSFRQARRIRVGRGTKVATCGSIIAGPPAMPRCSASTRQNWLGSNPIS